MFKKFLLPVVLALFFTACGARNEPALLLQSPIVGTTPSADVGDTIIAAAKSLGWKAQKVSNGLIYAQLDNRQHMAAVDIKYSATNYTISYKNSANLNFEVKDGVQYIHRNYNKWVRRLDIFIGKKLSGAARSWTD